MPGEQQAYCDMIVRPWQQRRPQHLRRGPRATSAGRGDVAANAVSAVETTSGKQATPARKLRALYLFAGKPRKWDMRDCLIKLGYENGGDIHVDCVDLQRKPWTDLSKKREREKIRRLIRSGIYDAILLSPPCSTFSRAPWVNFKGPRPVQSYAKPRGSDTLTGSERRRCLPGNIFADFT